MCLKRYSILLAIFFRFVIIPINGVAQTLSTGNDIRDELFLYEVKSVDEFIERFDDAPSSFIRNEFRKQNRPYLLTRAELLISLFNLDNNWDKDSVEIKGFVKQVLDKKHPQ